jgi:hypothetical protein
MTLSIEVHIEKVAPTFVFYFMLKFENFWTSTQQATLQASTPQFSACFEHFCHINFSTLLVKFSAEVLNSKLVSNLIKNLLSKFGNSWPSRFFVGDQNTSSLSTDFLGRQKRENLRK